jgi:hypothetical protein
VAQLFPDTGFIFRHLLRLTGLRLRYSNLLHTGCPPQEQSEVKAKVILRLTVNQPAYPGIRPPATYFLSLSWKLSSDICGFCYYGAPCMTRGWVCHLQLGLCPAAFLTMCCCFSVQTFPTWRARFPYLLPARNRVAQLYPPGIWLIKIRFSGSSSYIFSWRTQQKPPF